MDCALPLQCQASPSQRKLPEGMRRHDSSKTLLSSNQMRAMALLRHKACSLHTACKGAKENKKIRLPKKQPNRFDRETLRLAAGGRCMKLQCRRYRSIKRA